MIQARQRPDLIADGLKIPRLRPATGKSDFVELTDWIEVTRQDDDGNVFTARGVFYSIDLEFREVRA